MQERCRQSRRRLRIRHTICTWVSAGGANRTYRRSGPSPARPPIHTPRFQSNWDLSAARASATFLRLVDAFPGLGALKNDRDGALIGVSGYGEYRPIDQSGSEIGMQRNRRIELRFIMATPNASAVEGVVDRITAARSR